MGRTFFFFFFFSLLSVIKRSNLEFFQIFRISLCVCECVCVCVLYGSRDPIPRLLQGRNSSFLFLLHLHLIPLLLLLLLLRLFTSWNRSTLICCINSSEHRIGFIFLRNKDVAKQMRVRYQRRNLKETS